MTTMTKSDSEIRADLTARLHQIQDESHELRRRRGAIALEVSQGNNDAINQLVEVEAQQRRNAAERDTIEAALQELRRREDLANIDARAAEARQLGTDIKADVELAMRQWEALCQAAHQFAESYHAMRESHDRLSIADRMAGRRNVGDMEYVVPLLEDLDKALAAKLYGLLGRTIEISSEVHPAAADMYPRALPKVGDRILDGIRRETRKLEEQRDLRATQRAAA